MINTQSHIGTISVTGPMTRQCAAGQRHSLRSYLFLAGRWKFALPQQRKQPPQFNACPAPSTLYGGIDSHKVAMCVLLHQMTTSAGKAVTLTSCVPVLAAPSQCVLLAGIMIMTTESAACYRSIHYHAQSVMRVTTPMSVWTTV